MLSKRKELGRAFSNLYLNTGRATGWTKGAYWNVHPFFLLSDLEHTQGFGRALKKTEFSEESRVSDKWFQKVWYYAWVQPQHKSSQNLVVGFFDIPTFRKETQKKQESSAGIRLEDAWANLGKPSIACNFGSAFHNSIRSCMTILHSSFYQRCDVFLSQEFPLFVKLFQTSRVGW